MSWGRREVIQAVGGVALLPAGMFDFLGDDSEEETATQEDIQLLREELRDFKEKAVTSESDPAFSNSPAAAIQEHPLSPGTDVRIHHTRPEAGAYLSEASGAFNLDLAQEKHTKTVPAADSGTLSVSFSGAYQVAFPILWKPGDGVLSDVTVEKSDWITDGSGDIAGLQVDYNNSSTSDVQTTVEVIGFG